MRNLKYFKFLTRFFEVMGNLFCLVFAYVCVVASQRRVTFNPSIFLGFFRIPGVIWGGGGGGFQTSFPRLVFLTGFK